VEDRAEAEAEAEAAGELQAGDNGPRTIATTGFVSGLAESQATIEWV